MDLNNIKKLGAFDKIPQKKEKTQPNKQSEVKENIPDTSNLPKVSGALLSAYSGVVSFRGKEKDVSNTQAHPVVELLTNIPKDEQKNISIEIKKILVKPQDPITNQKAKDIVDSFSDDVKETIKQKLEKEKNPDKYLSVLQGYFIPNHLSFDEAVELIASNQFEKNGIIRQLIPDKDNGIVILSDGIELDFGDNKDASRVIALALKNGLDEQSDFEDFIKSMPKDTIYKRVDEDNEEMMISLTQGDELIHFIINSKNRDTVKEILDSIPDEIKFENSDTNYEKSKEKGLIPSIILELDIERKDELAKLEKLASYNENRKLNKEEIVACYGLNLENEQIPKFIENKTVLLEKYQDIDEKELNTNAAICVKHGVTTEKQLATFVQYNGKEIEYKNKEGKPSTYKISNKEVAKCIVGGFEDETQFKRYAYLRNLNTSAHAIRGAGNLIPLDTQAIIRYVKETIPDEVIAKEQRLYSLLNADVDILSAGIIANSEELTYLALDKETDDSIEDIVSYVQKGLNTKQQVDIYKEELKKGTPEDVSLGIALLGLEADELNLFKNLLAQDVPKDQAIKILNDENVRTRYNKFRAQKLPVTTSEVVELAKLSLDNFEQLKMYSQINNDKATKDLSFNEKIDLAKAGDVVINKYKTLNSDETTKDFSTYEKIALAKAGDVVINKYKTLKSDETTKDSSTYEKIALAKAGDVVINKYKTLNSDETTKDLLSNQKIALAKAGDVVIKKYKTLNSDETTKDLSSYDKIDLAKAGDVVIKKYKTLNSDETTKDLLSNQKIALAKSEDFEEVFKHLQDINSTFQSKYPSEANYLASSDKIALAKSKELDNFKDEKGQLKFTASQIENIKKLPNDFSQQQVDNYLKLLNKGYKAEDAIHLAKDEKYIKMLENKGQKQLTPRIAAFLATQTSITSLDHKQLGKIGKNALYRIMTGTTSQTFKIINKAQTTLFDDCEDLTSKDFDIESLYKDKTNTYKDCSFKNGFFQKTKEGGFSAHLKGKAISGVPVMFIQNEEHPKDKYIAYNGALTQWNEPKILEEKDGKLIASLKEHSNVSEKQAEILAEAAKNFIVNIVDKEGECIISKGIKDKNIRPFSEKDFNTEETKKHFEQAFISLKKSIGGKNIRKLKIHDILRLMPKDAVLSINPYTTAKENETNPLCLFSISAEWTDKDGRLWEFRTHSTDLNHIKDTEAKWIYRLGYSEPNITDKNQTYYYNGTDFGQNRYTGEDAHIEIEKMPFKKNSLIANSHFQNIMSQISKQYNDKQSIGIIAKKLGCEPNEDIILDICRIDMNKYLKYKVFVDNLCEKRGLPLIDEE